MPATAQTRPDRINTIGNSLINLKESRALPELLLLRNRLRDENELELLGKIACCQEPIVLRCMTCEQTSTRVQWCKRKWCPCCARRSAGVRSAELSFIVERMRWPLFVTLTMKNSAELQPSGIRALRRAFGKMRHRKMWKLRVAGGIAAVEVTNIGNGWHPHLHAVIDCQWLAWKTPMPSRTDSLERKKELFQLAAAELEATWAKILKQPTASVKVKRANKATIAKEVVKYTVKNEDLVMCEGPVGPLIRALDSCRLMTTFGRAHGQCVKDVRAAAKQHAKDWAWQAAGAPCKEEWDLARCHDGQLCCPNQFLLPDHEKTLSLWRNHPRLFHSIARAK
jgi:hypothetical protein